MSWENHPLPENNFDPDDKPVRDLFVLLSAALAVVVAVAWGLSLVAERFAKYIPFSVEERIAGSWDLSQDGKMDSDALQTAAESSLQDMAGQIAKIQGMPSSMSVRVHLVDADTVNAFATLGGHVVVFSGLLRQLPHENALVMLLGHEIGHVAHRDPISAMARGAALMSLLGMALGSSDTGALSRSLQTAGVLTTLTFSRDQERAADEAGLQSVRAWYGHAAGAADLMAVLAQAVKGEADNEWLGTHPDLQERITHLRRVQGDGETQPLSGPIADYIHAVREKTKARQDLSARR